MTPEKLYGMLTRYAASQGMELGSDRAFVLEILAGLIKNEARYGYRSCPCRLAAGERAKDADIVCPCLYMPPDVGEFGSCYCGLYVSPARNRGEAMRVKVPERRPMEKR